MAQKVLKVGSSAAVTIPKKSLAELGLKIGDRVTIVVDRRRRKVVVEPVARGMGRVIDAELREWTRKFIERYRPALEALSKK